jgi:hypothetical protein
LESRKIADYARLLRSKRQALLCEFGLLNLQRRAITAIESLARRWENPDCAWRIQAQAQPGTFPFSMTRVSLDALLKSLTIERLERLAFNERAVLERAPELIGFVMAGNTPLLGWTALMRSLLIGSAALVKAPSSPEVVWLNYFFDSLSEIDPDLAGLIRILEWSGGDDDLEEAFCRNVDKVVVYGGEKSVRAYSRRLSQEHLLAYGHRVSLGVVCGSDDFNAAASAFAKDILLYDQGGCLSPQTIFVEGAYDDAQRFGQALADSLAASEYLPADPIFFEGRGALVRNRRLMARFQADPFRIWEDERLRWTVIAGDGRRLETLGPCCIVAVTPAPSDWSTAFGDLADSLQGCGFSSENWRENSICKKLFDMGKISYLCAAGEMQAPPFDWQEDGAPLLLSLGCPVGRR